MCEKKLMKNQQKKIYLIFAKLILLQLNGLEYSIELE